MLRRARDRLWGYDFFISYHWASGGAYAVNLAARLRERGYEVFLDRGEYAMGDEWKSVGQVALRNTQRLVLVATREAVFESEPVAREVELFTERKRHCIPIFFGETFHDAGEGGTQASPVLERLPKDTLYIDEAPEKLAHGPSAATLDKLVASHDIMRRRSLRQLVTSGGVTLLATFAVFATLSWRNAVASQLKTEASLIKVERSSQAESEARMAEQAQEQRANEEARDGLASTTAYLAKSVLAQDPAQSFRIAEHAWSLSPANPSVGSALHEIAYAAPLGFELWRHVLGEDGEHLALSPDGQRIVVAFDHRVEVLSPAGERVHTLDFGDRNVHALALVPGSETLELAIAVGDEIEIHELDGRQCGVRRLPDVVGVTALAFSADGATMATLDFEGITRVVRPHCTLSFPSGQDDLAVSPTGDTVAFDSETGVHLYDLGEAWPSCDIEMAVIRSPKLPSAEVEALAFSPDGQFLAIGDDEGGVTRCSVESDYNEELEGFGSAAVNSLEFSARGDLLLSASNDGTARVWDLERGKLVKTLPHPSIPGTEEEGSDGRPRPSNLMMQARFSPRGDRIATVLLDGSVGYWYLGAEFNPGHVFDADVMSVDFSFDDSLLLSVTTDGMAYVSSVADMTVLSEQRVLYGEARRVNTACFDVVDASRFATGDERGNLSIYETFGGRVDQAVEAHTEQITRCAWSPAGDTLATVAADGRVRLWRLDERGRLLGVDEPLYQSEAPLWALSFARDGRALAIGGDEEYVSLLDLDGRELQRFELSSETSTDVKEIALDAAEQRLLTVDVRAMQARVWTLDGNERARVVVDFITAGAIDPHGQRVATGDEEGLLQLWELDEVEGGARALGEIQTGDGAIQRVVWSHDGDHVATAAAQKVRVWTVSESGLIGEFDALGLPELSGELSAQLSIGEIEEAIGPTLQR